MIKFNFRDFSINKEISVNSIIICAIWKIAYPYFSHFYWFIFSFITGGGISIYISIYITVIILNLTWLLFIFLANIITLPTLSAIRPAFTFNLNKQYNYPFLWFGSWSSSFAIFLFIFIIKSDFPSKATLKFIYWRFILCMACSALDLFFIIT